jgi:multidrug efflux pump subunit AcrA (membrane-fusion protein)
MNTSFFGKLWTTVSTTTKSVAGKTWKYAVAHKIIASIVVLAVVGGGYYGYTALTAGSAGTQYVLAATTQGPLNVTVTGSGQVSANDTLNLAPQASGKITEVNVKPGQSVKAGTIVAEIDMTTAAQSVQTAKQNLTSAQISYQQTLASSQTSSTNDQQSVSTAETNLNSSIATASANFPTVMNGLDSVLHSQSTLTGYTTEQNIDAYANYVNSIEAHQDESIASQAYSTARVSFQQTQALYTADGINPTSDQSIALANSMIQTATDISNAVEATLTYYNYINNQIASAKLTLPNQLSTQISSLTSYENTISSDNTSLASAKNALVNAQQTLANDSQSLNGSGTSLTLESAQLNVQKAQDSLTQAEQNEENYIVRAPFDGTIATVAGKVYDQGSSGGTIATLVTTEEYASLSLNETDAATVKVGQPATITFDALPNVTMEGTVAEIDGIGTVTQGVVTYTVKIGFSEKNSDIKPGMTANAVITTQSSPNAVQVPTSAIKTSGNSTYVEVATINRVGSTGSTTGSGAPRGMRLASSTTSVSRSLTVPAAQVTITRVPVTLGIANDTMTEVTSGLHAGQFVVTGTSTGTSKTTGTSSNSIFSSLFGGGRRSGATGTGGTRTTTGGSAGQAAPSGGFSGGGGPPGG